MECAHHNLKHKQSQQAGNQKYRQMEQRIGDIFPGNFAINFVCSEIVNQRRQQTKCREGDCLPPRIASLSAALLPPKAEFERIEKIIFQCAHCCSVVSNSAVTRVGVVAKKGGGKFALGMTTLTAAAARFSKIGDEAIFLFPANSNTRSGNR